MRNPVSATVGEGNSLRTLESDPAGFPWSAVVTRVKPHIVVFAAYVALGWRFFHIISHWAVNIFYNDQWDFNEATLFEKHTLWEIFRWQYGPQRHGLGGVAMKLLEPSIRWNSRYEAFGIGAIILLAAILALYLKTRLFGGIGYADVLIPAFFLTPAQFETVIGSTNPGWGAIPLLLIIVYCLCLTIASSHWKWISILLTNLFLIYTGYGIFLGLLTPAVTAIEFWRARRVAATIAFVISIASVLSFFIGYKPHETGAECFSGVPANPILYAMFICCMFANAAGLKGSVALPLLVGVAILIACVVALDQALRTLRNSEAICFGRNVVIVLLLTFCFVFMLATGYGRLCLGMQFAFMPRYVTYTLLAFYALYLFSLSLKRWRAIAIAGLCTVALLSSARMNKEDATLASEISHGKAAWRDCYLQRRNIQQCNALTNFQVYPDFGDVQLQEKLDFLEQKHLNLFEGSENRQ